MQIGVVFPQTEIGSDAEAIKEYGRACERMGYTHILAYDHVLGANTASRPDWKGPYKLESQFHEPFVLFSYLAGVTKTIGLTTGIIILPQRQTALVAKQAASLDVLSKGRLRLGIGIGWNDVEYEALNEDFHNRGKRSEEQVEVMRALWTKPAVTFKTKWHTITDAGINPMPVQRPIPVWFGGGTTRGGGPLEGVDAVIRRIAKLGDGWMPQWQPDDTGRALLQKFHGFCRQYGRDPKKIGLEGRASAHRANETKWADTAKAWQGIGATHFSVNTMGDGLKGTDQHLRRLEEFRKAVPSK
jgi:probable F420-dependent oxidoreductase